MTPEKFYGKDVLAASVIKEKYLQPGETIEGMFRRVAHAIALGDENDANAFYELLSSWRFVPGGRILAGAGVTSYKNSLTNCYTAKVDDHIWEGPEVTSIYKCLIDHALTYKYGGGTSANLSRLRPKDAPIEKSGGASSGPVGFMELFSTNTGTISSGRNRRGALLLSMRIDHPDIRAFIHSKEDLELKEVLSLIPDKQNRLEAFKKLQKYRSVQYANISVIVTDEFMKAVEANDDFELRWGPGDKYAVHGEGKTHQVVNARELFDEIATAAWQSAEPGILFYDNIIRNFTTQKYMPFENCNPCGEQLLSPNSNCNLGSFNLSKYFRVKNNVLSAVDRFDWSSFAQDIITAMRFMDNVIDYNADRHILPEQRVESKRLRRIGIGFMGLADLFVLNGLRYGDKQSIVLTGAITKFMRDVTWKASVALSRERGPASVFTEGLLSVEDFISGDFIQTLPKSLRNDMLSIGGPRNTATMTIPPTGTTGIIAQASSGIEPIFTKQTTIRRVRSAKDSNTYDEYPMGHKLLLEYWPDGNYPDYVVDALDVDPFERIELQAEAQKYIDSSISSTINLPKDTTLATIKKIYMIAWKSGLKGVTVYVDGSRGNIIQMS